jgi:hypothetical protein
MSLWAQASLNRRLVLEWGKIDMKNNSRAFSKNSNLLAPLDPLTNDEKSKSSLNYHSGFSFCFPEKFNFYDIGEVELVAKNCSLTELGMSSLIIAHRLTGEESGHCVIGFESVGNSLAAKSVDESIFCEAAGILVGKLVNNLYDRLAYIVEMQAPEVVRSFIHHSSESNNKYLVSSLINFSEKKNPNLNLATRLYAFVFKFDNVEFKFAMRVVFLPSQKSSIEC